MTSMPMKQAGFTLLELLISIAIFAVLSAACYQLFNYSSGSKVILTAAWDRLNTIQRAKAILEQDFLHVVARPIRDEDGDEEYALIGGKQFEDESDLITFSRQGWKNLTQLSRSTLQRVGYAFEEGALIRYYWNDIDLLVAAEPTEYTILDEINTMNIKFLYKKKWIDQWPPTDKSSIEFSHILPNAIHLKLDHKYYGVLDWYFLSYASNNSLLDQNQGQQQTHTSRESSQQNSAPSSPVVSNSESMKGSSK